MKKQTIALALSFGAVLFSAGQVKAATFTVLVNTTSLNSTTGSIDFQFNQGGTTAQAATVQISNFVGGGPGSGQQLFGSASGGPEPSSISLTNVAGDNEAFDSYKFGNTLAFNLNFTGPGVSAPTGTNNVSSLFTFTLYSDPAGNNEALTSSANGALAITLSPEGILTSSINTTAVTLTSAAQATPEPGSVALVAAPLALLLFANRRRFSRL